MVELCSIRNNADALEINDQYMLRHHRSWQNTDIITTALFILLSLIRIGILFRGGYSKIRYLPKRDPSIIVIMSNVRSVEQLGLDCNDGCTMSFNIHDVLRFALIYNIGVRS